MHIVQHGDLQRLDDVRRFTCPACGCVWDANSTEYRKEWERNTENVSCVCPTCGKRAYDGKRVVINGK